ncbi:hypothetical protein [Pontibacter fetidus]|uniref:Outer membrane protein beta-barrel domain-containing protein n=1 Tax=Pontibacter fetidus TaxID=2700082 RepID=A0A6B2H4C5_9BACT|nr:hypothetical protein [Pontibacter fetidus]NDK54610.1 hypothetical protein [Pontibacter fetidus]
MKRLILLVFTCYLIQNASAQNQPNSYFVSSGIGGSIKKENNGHEFRTFKITPSINYAINRLWSVGLFADYSKSTSKVNSTQLGNGLTIIHQDFISESKNWFVGPQARFYYPVISGSLYFYGEVQAGINSESINGETLGVKTEMQESPIGPPKPVTTYLTVSIDREIRSVQSCLSPGMVFFLTPKFGIELEVNILKYNKTTKDSGYRGEPQEQSLTADMSLANTNLGASFYF